MIRAAILSGLVLWTAPARASDDCPDLTSALRDIRLAIDEVRLDEARELSLWAEDGLRCQDSVVNTLTLTSLFQLVGAVQYFQGDAAGAELYLGRAAAIAPGGGLDPSLGSQVVTFYDEVRGRVLAVPTGAFQAGAGVQVWVDGRSLSPGTPLDVASGTHLVQRRDGPTAPLTNELVRVAPGQVVRYGLTPPPPVAAPAIPSPAPTPVPLPAPAPAPDSGGPSWGLVAGGAGTLAAGGVALVMAAVNHARFDATTDPGELSTLQAKTNTWATAGFALGGAGVILAGTGLALPGMAGVSISGTW